MKVKFYDFWETSNYISLSEYGVIISHLEVLAVPTHFQSISLIKNWIKQKFRNKVTFILYVLTIIHHSF